MKSIIVILTFIYSSVSFAQDIHFSQYYASSLTLNPAMTGMFNGKFRGFVNYRNQWNSVTVPYITTSIAGDINLELSEVREDFFGGGITMVYDQSGDGILSIIKIMPSFAYHYSFDYERKNNLSIGTQIGFVQKQLDLTNLIFPDQYNGIFFDSKQITNAQLTNENIFYPDLNVGILWQYVFHKTDESKLLNGEYARDVNMHFGVSAFHINQPNESFLGQTNQLKTRLVLHGGMYHTFMGHYAIIPRFITMLQGTANDIIIGMDFEYFSRRALMSSTAFFVGTRYRVSDALIVIVGTEYKDFRFGISYDINLSSLKVVSKTRGGIELSLIYIRNPRQRFMCPKFY